VTVVTHDNAHSIQLVIRAMLSGSLHCLSLHSCGGIQFLLLNQFAALSFSPPTQLVLCVPGCPTAVVTALHLEDELAQNDMKCANSLNISFFCVGCRGLSL